MDSYLLSVFTDGLILQGSHWNQQSCQNTQTQISELLKANIWIWRACLAHSIHTSALSTLVSDPKQIRPEPSKNTGRFDDGTARFEPLPQQLTASVLLPEGAGATVWSSSCNARQLAWAFHSHQFYSPHSRTSFQWLHYIFILFI